MDICVFGDSIGKGVVLQANTSRYKLFKTNLEKLLGLSIVKRHAQELMGYKSVFLELGGNDCDFAWHEVAENPNAAHSPNTPLAEFKELYRQLVEVIRSHGGNPVILTLPPLDPERFFNWVSRGLNRDNILKWLGDVDMIYRWQERYNLEVMLLASQMSVPIIDIRSAFLERNQYRDYLCSDGIHPNGEGYSLIYKTIAEQYQKGLA
jgi:acyl-CoA thioesterase-1